MTDSEQRARTLAELIAAAVIRYEFAEPLPLTRDGIDQWIRKLVAHVEQRDYAAAFELMIGKRQPDWSPSDVQAFLARRLKGSGPKRAFDAGEVVDLVGIQDDAQYPTTPEQLLALAARGLAYLVECRTQKPTADLPIFASVLLLDGRLLTVTCNSDNRIAVLKLLAQQEPVYGFFLVFDAFSHDIDTTHGKATKRDVLICQAGTREMRRMLRRSYEVVEGVAVFDPPLEDITETEMRSGTDPYAEIFVSVPPPSGAPS